MIKRIVTYDVRDDYVDFYDFVNEYGGKKLTESTYEFNTNLSQEDFEKKLKNVFSRGDLVFYISVNDKNELFSKQIKF